LAVGGMPSIHDLFWITIAMISARTAALCLNRLIDRKFDRANPRTSNWALASGKLSARNIWIVVFVFIGILLYAAARLNWLCFKLAPLAVIVLWVYSYTKRFTWWCHLILGAAIGMGPVGAWIAITGNLNWQPIILGAAVACWIAGFDTMYACQDIEFDRTHNLFSIPARFGEKGALIFSALFHLFTIIFLFITGIIFDLYYWYYGGVIFVTGLLAYEHYIVKPGNLSRVNFASFRINHFVGLIIFLTTLLDIFVS